MSWPGGGGAIGDVLLEYDHSVSRFIGCPDAKYRPFVTLQYGTAVPQLR